MSTIGHEMTFNRFQGEAKTIKSMRIIFVGIHGKPGMEPLDSRTRSGKLIDRIIEKLPGYEVLKTNLYDCDYMPPQDYKAGYKWANRINYTPLSDIVFTLGAVTRKHIRGNGIRFIPLGHPSSVWSHEKQAEYVERALSYVRPPSIKVLEQGFHIKK